MNGAKLVIDVTCRCNARCRYCRWGDGNSSSRSDRSAAELCVDPTMLRAASIDLVVLSGGEPMLLAGLAAVLQHYRSAQIPQIAVITNGLVATSSKLETCYSKGATGFAFSIDSSPDTDATCARVMTYSQHERVFRNLRVAGLLAESLGIELTVNCVLSAANCTLESIKQLAHDCAGCGASEIKFQPVFDDGYLGDNAPELALGPEHADTIRAIGHDVSRWAIATNPIHFFEDLANVCEGRILDGRSCSLDSATFVLQTGGVVICPWISSKPAMTAADLPRLSSEFRQAQQLCKTGPQCFCLQPRNQTWRFSDANA